jgi:nicotinamide-nucleotide amidase
MKPGFNLPDPLAVNETKRRPRVALVAIGDELLNGEQLDTNSSWLSERLWGEGWEVCEVCLVGDHENLIVATLNRLAGEMDLVLTTGGLGPTLDDLTRHAVARAVGAELLLDAEVVAWLQRLFESFGRVMSPANERQALFPTGAVVLRNDQGTAPGFRVAHPAGAWLASFPGPPRELHLMFENQLLPFLRSMRPAEEQGCVARFNLFGVSESDFAVGVGPWMDRLADPRMGVCASGRVLKVRVESTGLQVEGAVARFESRVQEFEALYGDAIFSRGDPRTATALGQLLMERQVTIATAESCTGGEVASRLVAQAGISEVFLEGFVTYSDRAKAERLGVPEDLLKAHGAVSAPVAKAMALGAAQQSGARLSISTTGIAGPGGGSEEKPVGLVFIGICLDGVASSHELRFPDRGRDLIRDWTATSACELARRRLLAE